MQGSLYERLGGIDAITAVVEDFAGRTAGDSRINGKFVKTDLDRLKRMLVDQVCEASGLRPPSSRSSWGCWDR